MVSVVVYELRTTDVNAASSQLVNSKTGNPVGVTNSYTMDSLSSDLSTSILAAVQSINLSMGTGTNATDLSFSTNGYIRTQCSGSTCESPYIVTFFTSDGLIVFNGNSVYISNPSDNLSMAMQMHSIQDIQNRRTLREADNSRNHRKLISYLNHQYSYLNIAPNQNVIE